MIYTIINKRKSIIYYYNLGEIVRFLTLLLLSLFLTACGGGNVLPRIDDPETGLDTDSDGIFDIDDTDDDNDSVLDVDDAFPLDANESTDTDNDGVGDNTDAFPLDADESLDTDGDGIGNNEDTDDDGDSIPDVFSQNICEDCVFPTDPELFVSSTFGPRLLSGNFDFHRGIDIHGDRGTEIYAMAEGVIFSISTGSIQIEHTNLTSATGGPVYSRYSHLDSIVEFENDSEGNYPAVDAGQLIGYMGNTGANNVHLHFEIREDTPFTLSYQLDNGGCRTDPCKDPHVNPFNYIGQDDNEGPNVEIISAEGESLKIKATVSYDEIDINRFEVRSPGNPLIVLDYNTRQGFNATSIPNIDRNPLESGPEFKVFTFNRTSVVNKEDFIVEIEFPSIVNYTSIRAFDTYGNVTQLTSDDDDIED